VYRFIPVLGKLHFVLCLEVADIHDGLIIIFIVRKRFDPHWRGGRVWPNNATIAGDLQVLADVGIGAFVNVVFETAKFANAEEADNIFVVDQSD
jgi:hypothetical protein